MEHLQTSAFGSVTELLDGFHSFAAQGNLLAYVGCLLREARYVGTDATESWTALEFFEYSKPHFTVLGKGWKYFPIAGSRKLTYFGGREETATCCSFEELMDRESIEVTFRGTGTAVRIGEHWFIGLYHLSIPIPNILTLRICGTIQAAENAARLEKLERTANQAAEQLLAELDLEDSTKSTSNKTKSNSKSGRKKK